ncbi:MAG: hypothetical protein KF832_30435 [Caldilineaceae bacterium]|nr:hypothetical protein [Caldilineaceae bacterium]
MMIYQRLFLLLLILAAFAWRVNGLTYQSLWRDEVDAIYFALRDLPDTLAMFGAMAQNGALYFLSLRGWFYLVGATEFALRYVSVLAGTLAIPLTWQVARRLCATDRTAAAPYTPGALTAQSITPLLAALLLAVNPYQLWYAQEGKMYALVIVLTLFAHWCWLTGMTKGGRRIWLLYLGTVSICLYIHLLTLIIIPLHLCWFLLAWPHSRRHWRGYGFALAGLTLPYLPFVWWQWAMLVSPQKLSGFTFTPLSEMLRTILMNHSNGLLPPPPFLRLLPIFFLGVVGLVLGPGVIAELQRRRAMASVTGTVTTTSVTTDAGQPDPTPAPTDVADLGVWRRYGFLVSWLLLPIAAIYLISLRQPVFTDRYIIWIAPAAMILLALGVQALYQNSGRLALPLVMILLIYTLGFWLQMGWRQKHEVIKYDLRSAIHYIAERRDPATLLILQIPHLEFSYRYYTSDYQTGLFARSDAPLGWWVGGLWTNGDLPDDQARALADQEMQQITAGVQELWVLSSEVEMWDTRHLMNEWLTTHGRVVAGAEFHGVHARHYLLERGEQP